MSPKRISFYRAADLPQRGDRARRSENRPVDGWQPSLTGDLVAFALALGGGAALATIEGLAVA
jgi:hypothetical protein